MQFIDLKVQYHRIQTDVDSRVRRVFENAQFIMGPEIKELELVLSEYVGAHCILVSSGTDAIMMALMALGIGEGDEVITPSFSFIATATMTKLLGATPVFVDINPKTYNVDPHLIERAITPKTKAILPVNLYGQCADFDAINEIARKYNLAVIEDAAQSFGALYKGRQSCNLGEIGSISCTSFFPSKPLGCYGDGGACFTQSDELANVLRQIRDHGQDKRYHHVRLGINGRLDTLQAAILLAKFEIFPDELLRRQQIASEYDSLLSKHLVTPYIEPHNQSTYAQYTIQVNQREQVIEALARKQIPTAVHYPVPIHQQPLFSSNVFLPHADSIAKKVLSLPFHPYLEEQQISQIAKNVLETLEEIEQVDTLLA